MNRRLSLANWTWSSIGLGVVILAMMIAAVAQRVELQRLAAVTQAAPEHTQTLHPHQGIETRALTPKKDLTPAASPGCRDAADGQVQQSPIGPPPQPTSSGRVTQRIIATEQGEVTTPRVYTNADLGRPIKRTAIVTREELASLAAHQFSLPESYPPGQQVVIIGDPRDGPFGPFEAFPPTAPLSNDWYFYEPSMFYGGPYLPSGRHHVAASSPLFGPT